VVVVDDEAVVHIARRQLGERVDCRIVLVEQRDRITWNHRVAHAARIHSSRGTAATERKARSPIGGPCSSTG
jgi:hypothetical protein